MRRGLVAAMALMIIAAFFGATVVRPLFELLSSAEWTR